MTVPNIEAELSQERRQRLLNTAQARNDFARRVEVCKGLCFDSIIKHGLVDVAVPFPKLLLPLRIMGWTDAVQRYRRCVATCEYWPDLFETDYGRAHYGTPFES